MTIEQGVGGEKLKILGSLAFDAHGLLHVSERRGGDRVLVFDGAGRFVRSWGTHGTGDGQFLFDYDPAIGVSPIAIAADGTMYIGDTTGRVQAFDGGGRFLRKWGGPGGASEVRRAGGLTIDGRDTLHVADADAHRIQMFDFGGRFLGTWGGPGVGPGQFDRPKQITIDREGNILVADEGNSRIQVFDRDRRFVRAIGRPGMGDGEMAKPGPRGVETDRRGDIYVTDKYNDRVQKFAADGRFIIQWGGFGSQGDKLHSPNEVRVDASGDLWVADDYRILVFKQ